MSWLLLRPGSSSSSRLTLSVTLVALGLYVIFGWWQAWIWLAVYVGAQVFEPDDFAGYVIRGALLGLRGGVDRPA